MNESLNICLFYVCTQKKEKWPIYCQQNFNSTISHLSSLSFSGWDGLMSEVTKGKETKVMKNDFHCICKSATRLAAWLTRGPSLSCPPGFHAASPVRKWVHAPGISPESSEKGGGQEDALPRLHHERLVSPSVSLIFSPLHTIFPEQTKH